jgi:hypothetical protein
MWFWNKPAAVPIRDGILRKAVLVGINAYPGCPLDGCRNDSTDTSSFLVEKQGFDPTNIKILLDGDATTANIKAALVWLSEGLKAGDIACFWYSGHGAQIPNADEADGLSECICPVDFDWSRELMLTDKDLVGIFSAMPAGVIFNWGSDSCHSGDLDREFKAAPKTNMGFWARTWRRFFGSPRQTSKAMPVPIHIANAIRRMKVRTKQYGGLAKGVGLNVGFISGCRSDQTSADTEVGGRPCGALTHYFLKNYSETMPLTAICEKIVSEFSVDGYDQVPCAEGSRKDRPWLRP